jgi:hypothetical protein
MLARVGKMSKSPLKTTSDTNKKYKRKAVKPKRTQGALNNMNQFGRRTQKFQKDSRVRQREVDFNPISKTISSYLESFATQGKDTFKSIVRSAKVIKSSTFEALLLKATWPEDVPVPKIALHQIIHESIPAFEKYMELHRQTSEGSTKLTTSGDGYSGCDDPYYMTNHKLYMKMIEPDWRTTLKSLFIFHSIFRDSSPKVCESFRQAMNKMKRKRAMKFQSDNYRYFDSMMIEQTDAENEDLALFVAQSAKFILHRAKYFSHSYTELEDSLATLSTTSTLHNLSKSIQVLKLAQHNLELGLNCKLTKPLVDKIVAVQSYRLIAKDVL